MIQAIQLSFYLLYVVAGRSYLARAAPAKAVIFNFPVRLQWVHSHGYCGELSIQQTALMHGVWVGQQQARDIGGGELLLGYPGTKQNNLEQVARALGMQFVTWDPDSETGQTKPTAYMLWMKQQLQAGRAVAFGARLQGDEDDEWYDHIMPAFGVYFDSSTAGDYDARDTLLWTDDFGNIANKSMSEPGFYAPRYKCKMPADTSIGCIPMGVPTFATALGGLLDPNNLFVPVRLVISSWSNGLNAAREPRIENRHVSAHYTLAFQPGASVQPGQRFSIYRCDRAITGRGGPPANTTSGRQLQDAGCRSWSFTMGPSTLPQLTHRTLGALWSNSVVYFLAVLQQ